MVGGSFRVPAGTGVRLLLARTIVAEMLPLPDGCRLTPLAWQGSTWRHPLSTLCATNPGWLISLVAGSGCQGECAVAVGCVGGLVIGHLVGEAVPQDLKPAIPQRAQG